MKAKLSIPVKEQEVVINHCPDEMGNMCEIYTTIPWLMKYLEKMVKDYPEQYQLVDDDQYSYTVKCEFRLVKPRKPKIMTDEQKAALAARLNK